MAVSILNPLFPNDPSKSRRLTAQQFGVIKDMYSDMLDNTRAGRRVPKDFEAKVLAKLTECGLPVDFDTPQDQPYLEIYRRLNEE